MEVRNRRFLNEDILRFGNEVYHFRRITASDSRLVQKEKVTWTRYIKNFKFSLLLFNISLIINYILYKRADSLQKKALW